MIALVPVLLDRYLRSALSQTVTSSGHPVVSIIRDRFLYMIVNLIRIKGSSEQIAHPFVPVVGTVLLLMFSFFPGLVTAPSDPFCKFHAFYHFSSFCPPTLSFALFP